MIRHWTFPPESTAEIVKKLLAKGDGATLEIHPVGTKDGGMKLLLVAKGASDGATALDGDGCPDDPTNEAHTCPPFCS